MSKALKSAMSGGEDPKKPTPRLRPSTEVAAQLGALAAQAAPASGRPAQKKKEWSRDELFEFQDSAGIKTGRYPLQHLRGVIQAAKATGQDPYEAAAFVLQESGLGMAGNRNLGYTYQDLTEAQVREMSDIAARTGIESRYLEPLILFRDKMAYAKKLGMTDRARQIQVYNGNGVLTRQMVNGADKAYGIPIGEGIDMSKNPIYGKRVLSLANDLKRNPTVRSLIEGGT